MIYLADDGGASGFLPHDQIIYASDLVVGRDRIEYVAMSITLAIIDKFCGPEPPTDADQQREAEYERLQRAFPSLETDRKGQKALSYCPLAARQMLTLKHGHWNWLRRTDGSSWASNNPRRSVHAEDLNQSGCLIEQIVVPVVLVGLEQDHLG